MCRAYQKTKTQVEEIKQTSEPDMAGMLELPNWEFETATINMLKALMDEVESMKETSAMLAERWKS